MLATIYQKADMYGITVQDIIEGILAIGVVVFAIAQWRNGRNTLNTETVQTYKDLLEVTEKKYLQKQEDMQKQINDMSTKMGEFKGLIAGKDAQIADYKQIIENRNPNLEKILNQMVEFMGKVDSRLTEIAAHQQKPFVAETTVHK